ncbi:hypothetical protein LO771_20655 [Streptacidiphilus sp. ASG 303]|uniref:hypothetical protein n=1 Tax=Streptacidiphilus sp. ASG 303 TaxID=2896847 RepID=UPI001E510E11|nr:hypothetical protein [Streptacidiphilus sp. ASG 303]MCD0484736.1 hypothetical protein [Streptacidiphilus sp. ASG 303]
MAAQPPSPRRFPEEFARLREALVRSGDLAEVPHILLAALSCLGRVGWALLQVESGGRHLYPDAAHGLPPEWSPSAFPLSGDEWPAVRAAAGEAGFGAGPQRPYPLARTDAPAAWAALPLAGAASVLVCLRPGSGGWSAHERDCLLRIAGAVADLPASTAHPGARLVRDPIRIHPVSRGTFAFDPVSQRVTCDRTFASLHGIPGRAGYHLRTLLALLPAEEAARVRQAVNRMSGEPGEWEVVYRAPRPDGAAYLRAQILSTVNTGTGRETVRGTVTEVTEEFLDAAADLQRLQRNRLRRTGRLAALSAAVASAAGTAELLAAVHASLAPAGVAALLLAEGRGGRVEVVATAGRATEEPAVLDGTPLDSSLPLCDALRRQLPVFATSPQDLVDQYPHLALLAPRLEHRAWAALPVPTPAAAHPAACLVSFDRPHVFEPQNEALLVAAAELLGQALQRCRAYDAACARTAALLDSVRNTPFWHTPQG